MLNQSPMPVTCRHHKTCLERLRTVIRTLSKGSDVDEDDDPSDEFRVDGERLEDDESLRLHILGVQSAFSKPVSEFSAST